MIIQNKLNLSAVVVLLSLVAVAAPKIVYVVPGGAGEKDGTSWANAYDSVSNAYASAAAFLDGGFDSGEVWVRKGRYVWPSPKTQCIWIQSHVSVRGGFSGNETLASQANPKVNVTVFSGDFNSDDIWLPNDVTPVKDEQVKIWGGTVDDPILNEPNPDDRDDYWAVTKNINDCLTGFTTVGSVDSCEFSGVWFSCFVSDGVAIKHPSTNIRFVNCGFVGGNTARNGASYCGGVSLTDTHATFSACEFVNNHNCVVMKHSSGAAAPGKTLFTDCTFRRTNNSVFYASRNAGGAAADNEYAFEDCLFEKNRTAVCYVSGTQSYTFSFADCVFRKNVVSGSGIVATSGKTDILASIRLDRCEFTDNSASANSGMAATCLWFDGMGKRQVVRDCYFARNDMVYSGAIDKGGASVCCVTAATQYPAFVNCTFEDNRATATETGMCAGTILFANVNVRMGFANCVFMNNSLASVLESQSAEIYSPAPAAGAAVTFANTIFVNADSGYQPYRQGGGTSTLPLAIGMVVPELEAINLDAYSGVKASIQDQDPRLADIRRKDGDGFPSRGVDWNSPYRKVGYTIVADVNGDDYYVDSGSGTKPWRTLCGGGASTADELGITPETPIIPDAFGEPRVRGRIAYGPLVAPRAGLLIICR